MSARQEIYKATREGQDKYTYFLLAAAGAAIAFAVTQSQTATLTWSKIPLALAVLSWAFSFYAGCHQIRDVTNTRKGGAATSVSAKPRRCCVRLMRGSGGGCEPSPGSNGSAEPLVLQSCDTAASAGTWRRKPLAAHMAPGGSQTAPHSPLPCQMLSSVRSA